MRGHGFEQQVAPIAGTKTASLASLTSGTAYTYKAYSKAGCSSDDLLATATFTTTTAGEGDS